MRNEKANNIMKNANNNPRLKVTDIEVTTDLCNLYPVFTEDGEAHVADFLLVALGEDGETYFHNYLHQAGYAQDEEEGFNFVVRGAPKLEAVADKVRAVGSIDPSLWTKVVPLDLEAELTRH
jgi:hypothetical protein